MIHGSAHIMKEHQIGKQLKDVLIDALKLMRGR